MNDTQPDTKSRRATRGVPVILTLAMLLFASGCVPTVSMHSYRDVELTLVDGVSGNPIAEAPLEVRYGYAPADSPFFYHIECRTPDDVQARTDGEGKAIVRLANYSWDINMYVNDGQGEDVFFPLDKTLIRDGGVLVTQRRINTTYKHDVMKLELKPVHKRSVVE